MSRLVRESGDVVESSVEVKKNIRLCTWAARGECSASLTLGGINVNPAALGETCLKSVIILVAEYLNGAKRFLKPCPPAGSMGT